MSWLVGKLQLNVQLLSKPNKSIEEKPLFSISQPGLLQIPSQ